MIQKYFFTYIRATYGPTDIRMLSLHNDHIVQKFTFFEYALLHYCPRQPFSGEADKVLRLTGVDPWPERRGFTSSANAVSKPWNEAPRRLVSAEIQRCVATNEGGSGGDVGVGTVVLG